MYYITLCYISYVLVHAGEAEPPGSVVRDPGHGQGARKGTNGVVIVILIMIIMIIIMMIIIFIIRSIVIVIVIIVIVLVIRVMILIVIMMIITIVIIYINTERDKCQGDYLAQRNRSGFWEKAG